MRRTFKYRLFPTPAQRTALQKSLDACRWVYNKTLEVRKDAWKKTRKPITKYDTIKMLPAWKKEYPFLTQAYSQSLQDACERVDLAFRGFFRRVKAGDKPGYPRFRGHYRYDSFTFPQSGFGLPNNKRLRISRVGEIRIKLHRPIPGQVKRLIVKRDRIGNWYACFICKIKPKPLPITNKIVGIDLGLTKFAVLSNGKVIRRKRWMKQDTSDIARLQRKKEQFSRGSKERRKTIRALQHAYQRQTNRRNNFSHQESKKLIDNYDLIVFEKLNIKDMQRDNSKVMNQNIDDVGWGKFVRNTAYKAEYAGRAVVLVDPRNTTKMCSDCGILVPKALNVRVHNCPECGLIMDRDLNASINILRRGLSSVGPIPKSSLINLGEWSPTSLHTFSPISFQLSPDLV